MEDVIIRKIESAKDEVHVYIQLPRKVHKCPKCGELTERVHDYRERPVKDIPFGRTTLLYLKAVAWAVENNITNGMSADKFAPEATCTRGQVVTFLYRATKD